MISLPPSITCAQKEELNVPANAQRRSYGGDPHHHLAVGSGTNPRVVGPQLTEDVQDGVSTVVVQNSS